jgi:hypothetical protein
VVCSSTKKKRKKKEKQAGFEDEIGEITIEQPQRQASAAG